ncbi:hypothetical protein BS47DRAFT_254350 [Hydnum rufescens UP504]|uniref:Uncharacterized protein n=1 Tax=Hydnum rufescens UP504 TaxID=1448309 RepID=A0A9P6AM98_9AGAM|nr:hypothetical protein BS47DRAFT_254350 [Hydnum rufescens UP504]
MCEGIAPGTLRRMIWATKETNEPDHDKTFRGHLKNKGYSVPQEQIQQRLMADHGPSRCRPSFRDNPAPRQRINKERAIPFTPLNPAFLQAWRKSRGCGGTYRIDSENYYIYQSIATRGLISLAGSPLTRDEIFQGIMKARLTAEKQGESEIELAAVNGRCQSCHACSAAESLCDS